MRTSEERVQELHKRMSAMKQAKTDRRYALTCAGAGAVCLALLTFLAVRISGLPVQEPGRMPGIASASIFADRGALGYVVIALLAFCVGVLLTVFCFRLKKHMNEEDRHDDRNL